MRIEKDKKIVSAYMTIEASLLFPIVLMVLVIIFYMIFYCYDQTIAFQNSAITAMYGQSFSYTKIEKDVLAGQMHKVLNALDEGQYLSLERLEQSISMEDDSILVSHKGTMVIPVLNMGENSKLTFAETIALKEIDSVFYIRQIRKVKQDEN